MYVSTHSGKLYEYNMLQGRAEGTLVTKKAE